MSSRIAKIDRVFPHIHTKREREREREREIILGHPVKKIKDTKC
jgi:hypothetical protein